MWFRRHFLILIFEVEFLADHFRTPCIIFSKLTIKIQYNFTENVAILNSHWHSYRTCLFPESTSELIDGKYGDTTAQLIYGTFTTPPNSISGSAVCAFSLQDITDTFEGNFKEQAAINSNWLPVLSNKVPDPRPGQCHNDSRTLPDLTLNFIKTHSLMDESVPSFFGTPIVIRSSFQ